MAIQMKAVIMLYKVVLTFESVVYWQYHRRVLLSIFHFNAHKLGFHPQTQTLVYCAVQGGCRSNVCVHGWNLLSCIFLWGCSVVSILQIGAFYNSVILGVNVIRHLCVICLLSPDSLELFPSQSVHFLL